jgi:hypothetical protein
MNDFNVSLMSFDNALNCADKTQIQANADQNQADIKLNTDNMRKSKDNAQF